MGYTIAMAGKGGVGKTTLTGFLIDYLCKTGRTPILAVDADANSNLNDVLGVTVDMTLGEIREEVASAEMAANNPIPASMTKQDYMNFKINSALIEEDDYDMLVMGRSQGKGCYCFVNGLLQAQLSRLASNYKYIVVDNEAGLEHISRGILPSVDVIILVSDCSRRGIQAAGRIAELAREMNLSPKRMQLIVNRASDKMLDPKIVEEIAAQSLDLLGVVPQDDMIYRFDCEGRPMVDLPPDAPSRAAFESFIGQIF